MVKKTFLLIVLFLESLSGICQNQIPTIVQMGRQEYLVAIEESLIKVRNDITLEMDMDAEGFLKYLNYSYYVQELNSLQKKVQRIGFQDVLIEEKSIQNCNGLCIELLIIGQDFKGGYFDFVTYLSLYENGEEILKMSNWGKVKKELKKRL